MPQKHKDIAGLKFGMLTAVKRMGLDRFKRSSWLCLCGCGVFCLASLTALQNGDKKSCGCKGKIDQNLQMVGLKRCTKCQEVKDIFDFSGHGHWCRKCEHTCKRKWRIENWEAELASCRERRKNDPLKRQYDYESLKQWRKKNIDKWKAQTSRRSKDKTNISARKRYRKDPEKYKAISKEYSKNNPEKVKIASQKHNMKNVYELSDTYIKSLLTQGTILTSKDIPDEMVEVQRLRIKLKRQINKGD